jgi:hypothetical protein
VEHTSAAERDETKGYLIIGNLNFQETIAGFARTQWSPVRLPVCGGKWSAVAVGF